VRNNGRGRGAVPDPGRKTSTTPPPSEGAIGMVSHRGTGTRAEALERRRRIARLVDRELSLAEYYRTWGWPHGRYCRVVEGWRSA
jgi:hypothetical protein